MDNNTSNKQDVAIGTSDIETDLSSSSSTTVSSSTATSRSRVKTITTQVLDSVKDVPFKSVPKDTNTIEVEDKNKSSVETVNERETKNVQTSFTLSDLISIESDILIAGTEIEHSHISPTTIGRAATTIAEQADETIKPVEQQSTEVRKIEYQTTSESTEPLAEQPVADSILHAEDVQDHKAAEPKIKFKTIKVEEDYANSSSATEVSLDKDSSVRFAKKDSDPVLKSSKSRYVKKTTSGMLKASKSHHVKSYPYEDDKEFYDETDESSDSTNLRMGHVFVYMVFPPDGGYGWFITFISFLCQVVVDGIMFAIGIILPHIATDLNIPGSKVILVASMQIGFYFLFGTVSSAFINKYGFRPVALTGCILAITVLSIATFSTNLPMMIFFYSFLGGPSLSMIWVSSQLIIGYYFDKFRPIANGISCSGAGAGIMIFSYMNSVLVPTLGWRNLMRVHVGFLVLMLLMTLTFIEVTPTRIGRVKEPLLEETESESSDTSVALTRYSRYKLNTTTNEQQHTLDDNYKPVVEKPIETPRKESHNCCAHLPATLCPALYQWLQERREKKAAEEATKRYVIKQDLIEKQDLFYSGPKEHKKVDDPDKEISSLRPSLRIDDNDVRAISLEELKSSYRRTSIIKTLSTMQIKKEHDMKKAQKSYAELRQTQKYPLLSYLSPKNLLHPKVRKAFSLLFDFRLMAIMEFRILLLSAFLFPMGFNIPFVYSTVRVQIDKSLAKLISPTIGFSNFAFRIASGFVAFKFRAYTTYICGGGMFFGGIAVLTSAFYGLDVVWFQFLYAMCYGIAPAFYSTLRAIIYVQSLGLDKLTNAFGLTALAMGMGVFIGTTAGGILNDLTGSYTASFIFAGFCICTAGALKMLLPFFIKRAKDKEGIK